MILRSYRHGFTLVEVLLTVTIIGMLAALLLPAFNLALRSRQNAQCASHLRRAVAAIELYRSETGSYPVDQVVPSETTVAGMDPYFANLGIDWWSATTELGGRWDWDIGYHGFAASLSLWTPTASQQQLREYDKLIDDGNLDTGKFRKVGTQYHYILQE